MIEIKVYDIKSGNGLLFSNINTQEDVRKCLHNLEVFLQTSLDISHADEIACIIHNQDELISLECLINLKDSNG